MPLLECAWTQILAAYLAAADQTRQLIAGFDAAGPCVGMLVDAHLVQLRRVDAVEPVRHIGEQKGASIPDDRAGGPALACGEMASIRIRARIDGVAVARGARINRFSLISELVFALHRNCYIRPRVADCGRGTRGKRYVKSAP